MGGVLSSKLGQLLRLTMRSNAGRRTRLRAPRQQQERRSPWGFRVIRVLVADAVLFDGWPRDSKLCVRAGSVLGQGWS
jgi:hypothetical protein